MSYESYDNENTQHLTSSDERSSISAESPSASAARRTSGATAVTIVLNTKVDSVIIV